MPLRDTSGIGERIPKELIDADFSIATSFVEMAAEESGPVASQLLEKAEEMLRNIEARLMHMMPAQKEVFKPRCAELAEAIDAGKRRIQTGE